MEDRKHKGRDTGRLGAWGENEVCRFLVEHGHTVIERNWRCGHLEIDIISLGRDGIHFVEVKTRRSQAAANAVECVGPLKQKRLAVAAARYLREKRPGDVECFFDVAAVTAGPRGTEIEYIPRAFVPVSF